MLASLSVAPPTSIMSAIAPLLALQRSEQEYRVALRARDAKDLAVGAGGANLAAARAVLASLQARIAADKAKYGDLGQPAELSKAASRAERQANLLVAQATLVAREQAAADAEARGLQEPGRAAAIQAAVAQRTAARTAVQQAEAASKQDSTAYTALSPVYPAKSTGRRKALAGWIASKDNPLTARVAVNHLWSWHFGRPLVETTFNFGRSGKLPSHPELLDWLAAELMDNGWHMKPLHRLIVTSNAYRMRSHVDEINRPNLKVDPDNRLLWRFPPARMEAEEVRDGVLYVAGELDAKMGGPEIPHEEGLSSHRRSLYFAHHGESKMEFLELFDAANPCECYRRTLSVLPQQALALSNSELTLRQGRVLARKLWAEVGPGPDAPAAFVRAAFEQTLGRPPTPAEQEAVTGFLARQGALFRDAKLVASGQDGPSADPVMRARENLVIALFNHNDFVTIR